MNPLYTLISSTLLCEYVFDMAKEHFSKVRVLCSGMGAAMLAMAAGLHLKQLASLSSTIAITGTVAYMVFFALGAGPVPGLLVPEVTPARLRGKALIIHVSHLPPSCCCQARALSPSATAYKSLPISL